MLDGYGRRVRYLRISVTDRCNLRCVYCMPHEGVDWVPHDRIMTLESMAAVARAAAQIGFDKVRVTGGEPLVRRNVLELISMLRAIPGLEVVAMTTNGTLLAPVAADLAARGLTSVNISLDTLDPARYAARTRGGRVEEAIAGVRAARTAGLPVKLNVVVSPDENAAEEAADLLALRAFAAEEGCAIQTIRRYDLTAPKQDSPETMRPQPCSACDRIRLLATGHLKPCLHSDLTVLVDSNDIAGSIRACVALKPPCGQATGAHLVSAIGG